MTACYTQKQVRELTGLSSTDIKWLIRNGQLKEENGKIAAESVDKMRSEKEEYVSFLELSHMHLSEKYKDTAPERMRLRSFLEKNHYFNVPIVWPSELLTGKENAYVYFKKTDIPKVEEGLTGYFTAATLSEEDKIQKALEETPEHPNTKKYIRARLKTYYDERPITPAVTRAVELLLQMPDVLSVTDKQLKVLFNQDMNTTTKDIIIRFLNYVKLAEPTHYSLLSKQRKEVISEPAYSDETYLTLAKCIFNADYIAEQRMIERALDNRLYIEMWLYLALFFTCGWRAQDICNNWQYLHLDVRDEDEFGLNPDTLYDDILYDRLPDSLYEDVCKYAISSIQISGAVPSKTSKYNPTSLTVFITPELHPFFGLLTLIAEAVHLRTGEGYMMANRTSDYQKKTNVRSFFGMEMYEAIGKENIHSRRLNKDFLQGIESAARQSGCGGIMASAVASYARNHTNLNTIASYLRDHNLHGENAEMVLFLMMERGAFGFEAYQTLLTAFPDAMRSLPLKKQNELIAAMDSSPYAIEMEQSGNMMIAYVQESFNGGNEKELTNLLKSMFEISQGRGAAMDEGVHCTLRARNELCVHPDYGSCIEHGCPYLVFTRYGYLPLLRVLKDYRDRGRNGDLKAFKVLQTVLFPRYRSIINRIIHEMNMSQAEKNGLKLLMEETLNAE